jgi:cbb3-type cytochrome oxidase subunit 3
MFKQFSTLINGNEGYLITSLGIFVLFFVLVGLFLFLMKKDEVAYMSQLPLNDKEL